MNRPRRLPRCTALLAPLAMLAACAPHAEPPAAVTGAPKNGAPLEPYRLVFRCEGDYRVAVRQGADRVTLYLGARELALPQQIAASGTRYSADGVTFWSKGLLATLETPTASYRDCMGQPAWTEQEADAMLRSGAEEGVPLEGTEWRLSELNGAPALTPPDGRAPTLRFDAAQHRVTGFAGCNQMSGSYSRTGEQLSVGKDLITTRMACIEPALNRQESELLDVLLRVTSAVVWGQMLTLYIGKEPAARFTTDRGQNR